MVQTAAQQHPPVLEFLERELRSALFRSSVMFLGDLSAHIPNDSQTWKSVSGNNDPIDLNLIDVLLLYICACHRLSIINNMFRHEGVHLAPGNIWPQFDAQLGHVTRFATTCPRHPGEESGGAVNQ